MQVAKEHRILATLGYYGGEYSRIGTNTHTVVIEPLESGRFLVHDPGPGRIYEVTEEWIRRFVASALWRVK